MASDARKIKVNITGANDNPTLSASVDHADYLDPAADDTFGAVSGTLSTADRDNPETATYSSLHDALPISVINSVSYDVSKAGTYGTLHLNSSTGAYTFVANDTAIEARKIGRAHV